MHRWMTTDSTYVKDGIAGAQNWKKNGWKTAAKKPVKNQDLWMRLDEQSARHRIDWCWVSVVSTLKRARGWLIKATKYR